MPRGRKPKSATAPVATPSISRSRTGSLNREGGPSIANQNVVTVERQSYGSGDLGTTEKLFPDLIPEQEQPQEEQPEEEVQGTEPEVEPDKAEETDKPEADEPESGTKTQEGGQEPEGQQEPQNEFFEVDNHLSKKVKVKIDGEEGAVTLSDLIRSYQTDQHLGRKGNQVGEQRRALAEERRKLEELRNQLNAPKPRTSEYEDDDRPEPSRSNDPRDQKISQLEQMLQQLTEVVRPTAYQSARQKLADELKADGFDDFIEYIPKIDAHVATVNDEGLFNYYNTPEGAKALYFQMKAKELKEVKQAPPPVQKKEERPRPPIVKVQNGRSSSDGMVDDWNVKMKEALDRAKANPKDREAWNEVLKMKGLL